MKRKTVWLKDTREIDEDGTEIMAGVEYNYYTKREKEAVKFLKRKKRLVEKIFGISLRNRFFDVEFNPKDVAVTFCNNDSCFGYTERLKTNDFWKRYKKLKREGGGR